MGVEAKRERNRAGLMPNPYPGPFRQECEAPAEVVYDLLADLRSHLGWSGERMPKTFRLLSMDAPPGPARVGTEFRSMGADGKKARWHDRSVVTEATRPTVFEFVTEGRREADPGTQPIEVTTVARYEITPRGDRCEVLYVGRPTRFTGPPGWMRAVQTPLVRWVVWRVGNAYARKGFRSLIAIAEERAGRPRERASRRRSAGAESTD